MGSDEYDTATSRPAVFLVVTAAGTMAAAFVDQLGYPYYGIEDELPIGLVLGLLAVAYVTADRWQEN